jgi:Heparinase II/III-like protein
MFWLAREFNRPEYARYETQVATPRPLDLLWFDALRGAAKTDLPLDKYFRGAEVATFRSAWEDRDAVFAGFKAGDNKANHSHLDLGSFVLDALGKRWAMDLGADDYNLPGYFGGQRWHYYRLRTEGHNTLVLNPGSEPDQNPKASARIVRFETKPDRAFAIAGLTQAYSRDASNVERGIALLNRKRVLLQDEIESPKADEIWWFMHTPAEIRISKDGTTATLSQGDARLLAHLLSPAKAAFSAMEAEPLPTSPHPQKQAKNGRVRKLAVHLKNVTNLRLAVLFVPLRAGELAPKNEPKIVNLEKW